MRCGAAERETEAERSTSYGEGEHQPAKTEMKARGRTEQRIAGQDREEYSGRSRGTGEPPWLQTDATHRGAARSGAESERPGTMSDEQTPKGGTNLVWGKGK